MITQREYDEMELRHLEWQLGDVEDLRRQVAPTPAGVEYRRTLEADIARLRERLASESA